MHIETERLIVRDFVPEDAKDLHEILGDGETMRFCEPPYDYPGTQEFLRKFCVERHGAVAAVHKAEDKVIGYILFNGQEADIYEIGWIFNRRYLRRGYAYEACGALIAFAFEHMNAHRIFAETTDEVRSVGLMKKLGMKPEGVLRQHVRDEAGRWTDMHLYGILREDRV